MVSERCENFNKFINAFIAEYNGWVSSNNSFKNNSKKSLSLTLATKILVPVTYCIFDYINDLYSFM